MEDATKNSIGQPSGAARVAHPAFTPDTRNPLPCGCGIKGTPWLNPHTSEGYRYKDLFIDFCPLHAAAPALYEACEFVKAWLARLEDSADYEDPLTEARRTFHAPLHAKLDAALALTEGDSQ